MIHSRLTRALSTLIFAVAASTLALTPAADPTPATRAARLTLAQGTVTITTSDSSATVPAQANLPLLTGVQIATGSDGQAEVEFEDGSVVRLTPNSALSLDNLAIGSDGVFITDLTLLHGLAYCEFRATPQYSFMLNAGGDILSTVENTTVRINFDEPPATFAVLDGTAEIDRQAQATAGYQTQVHAGETLRADPQDQSRYFLTQEIAGDSWDQWNQDLDQQASAQSADSTAVRDTYAGADGYGWSDLDANGNWYNVPGEGPVWQPQAADTDDDFDPYSNGAWVYYPATGYIWASSYSWGWTPYRCGNWSFYNGFGWGWAPGAGCGARGWGFTGAGRPVNINRTPRGYEPVRVPRPRPGPLPPILPGHPYNPHPGQQPSSPPHQGPRSINGIAVSRISPNHIAATGDSTGSSLRRDFPIDPTTRIHVLGLTNLPPAVTRNAQSGNGEPASAQMPHLQHNDATSPSTGQHSSPTTRPDQHPWPENHWPGLPTAEPGNRPQHNEPPSVSSRPENSGTPQQPHPANEPPRQESHPSYAPPPTPRPESPHPAPPPPPQPHSPK